MIVLRSVASSLALVALLALLTLNCAAYAPITGSTIHCSTCATMYDLCKASQMSWDAHLVCIQMRNECELSCRKEVHSARSRRDANDVDEKKSLAQNDVGEKKSLAQNDVDEKNSLAQNGISKKMNEHNDFMRRVKNLNLFRKLVKR